jgi:dTDP-4-amino-4,6-dideoxygalactose transaminase
MPSGSFRVVQEFEKAVAEFSGAKHCIAVNSGTSAIFLSLALEHERNGKSRVYCPAQTFVSVPMSILHAGHSLELMEHEWKGVYRLIPTEVIDGALRFRKGMYEGGLHCLSFHARKHLNIGEGGAILTNDKAAAEWLRLARYSGRRSPDYKIEDIKTMGWQMYMTPEKAARGLHLLGYLPDNLPDREMEYTDLRRCKVFQ